MKEKNHEQLSSELPPQGRSVREAYIQAGEPRRARAVYTDEALPAWRKTPGALEWLRGMLAQLEGEAEA